MKDFYIKLIVVLVLLFATLGVVMARLGGIEESSIALRVAAEKYGRMEFIAESAKPPSAEEFLVIKDEYKWAIDVLGMHVRDLYFCCVFGLLTVCYAATIAIKWLVKHAREEGGLSR